MAQQIYRFGGQNTEGTAEDLMLLGGKGANLAEMARLGLPVPPGFTITTVVCNAFLSGDGGFPDELLTAIDEGLAHVSAVTGRMFGGKHDQLLVSVRSGARASMPGMMDTVLNLGLNDETVRALERETGDARFAYDSYRRFIQMYGQVVLGVDHGLFEEALDDEKIERGIDSDLEMDAAAWEAVVGRYLPLVETETGKPFPQDPRQQLLGAIAAVFRSWRNPRAERYRHMHGIPASWGTAVNVQAMVFGNLGTSSATGVAFTRNPSTGAKELYGEFLINAQGEDVVAGIRTPQDLTETARLASGSDKPSLEKLMPDAFSDFCAVAERLEQHYRDMQDLEFTIERGKLWMLQARSGKRTIPAALKIAVDMVDEGIIDEKTAVCRIDAAALDQLLHPTIDPAAPRDVIGHGLPASPGAASGAIVFSSEDAETARGEGREVILVRVETSPEDIHGMHAAQAILTTRGGMTSHAAVVARGMGKPCVCGAGTLRVDYRKGELLVRGRTLRAGDVITVDGSTGQILFGRVAMRQPELSGDFARIMSWADKLRRMTVRANAETPADARTAREFGAEGIGLCRTEHMFFEDDRIMPMREMILADTVAGRRSALDKLLPYQRADFTELFQIMAGLPVTIRLLDPPLHEFLPKTDQEIAEVAKTMGIAPEKLRRRADELSEINPMLGNRGARLAVCYPEIVEMQTRAIIEAALDAGAESGQSVVPEIMVPLVAWMTELDHIKARIDAVAQGVIKERGARLDYLVGTMIELPRAVMRAHVIAEAAEFFSFGTNDLTQSTFGMSRDDAAPFINEYIRKGIIEHDPFITLDLEGVGEFIRMAAERGRKTRPDIKLGICGEHGGEPKSIRFCEEIGLDYTSCSPFRVPVARLAAAQAAVLKGRA
jgi:pyruvate,orthophosphate dikinase